MTQNYFSENRLILFMLSERNHTYWDRWSTARCAGSHRHVVDLTAGQQEHSSAMTSVRSGVVSPGDRPQADVPEHSARLHGAD
jgi:hypothetical protein